MTCGTFSTTNKVRDAFDLATKHLNPDQLAHLSNLLAALADSPTDSPRAAMNAAILSSQKRSPHV